MGSISADKQKAVQLAMDQIERRFVKGYIMKLGGRMLVDVPVISTGSLALDHALGLPRRESKGSEAVPGHREECGKK